MRTNTKYIINCCINRKGDGTIKHCCASKGSEIFPEIIKKRCKALGIKNIEVIASGCLSKCKNGKTILIEPDNVYYHYDNEQDIELILKNHICNGKEIANLKIDTN
jgi:(2Fe-2S) ferredoxin